MMAKTILYNCTDDKLISKITDLSIEFSKMPLNNRSWAYKKFHQNLFEVLSEKGYLNAKLGYSMYVLRTLEEDLDKIPRLIMYKRLTDDRAYIIIAFNAEIKETPES